MCSLVRPLLIRKLPKRACQQTVQGNHTRPGCDNIFQKELSFCKLSLFKSEWNNVYYIDSTACCSCWWHYRRGRYDVVTKLSLTDGTSQSVRTLLAPRPLTPGLVGLWLSDARYRQQTRVINWPSRRYPQCIATPTGDTALYINNAGLLIPCALFLFILFLYLARRLSTDPPGPFSIPASDSRGLLRICVQFQVV